jgi:hypothetical protein
MPGVSGVTVVTKLVCSFHFACEAAGAARARHSLRPLIREGAVLLINSGAMRRGNAELYRKPCCDSFLGRPILRDAAHRPLLRMRSPHLVRGQTLMVRRPIAPSRTMRPWKERWLFNIRIRKHTVPWSSLRKHCVRRNDERSTNRRAAVDHDGLPGHEGARACGEEHGGAGDFVGFADPQQRRTRGGGFQRFRIFP